jgi:ferredoxin
MHCSIKLKSELESLSRTRAIETNDLRASEGRETEALNCKPSTNLKEKSELSN